MKHIILSIGILAAIGTTAQEKVSMGAGYADQIWYSMENGEQSVAARNSWDLAFDASGFGSTIRINGGEGVKLYVHPTADTSNWNNLDTAGLSNWNALYNSEETWEEGAFNKPSSGGQTDLGWGEYSMITHQVVGNKLFVAKLPDGSYKKVWIKSLASKIFTVRYANLDNSADMTQKIKKGDFTDKNFGYLSLSSQNISNPEPYKGDWDITFTKYITDYPLTGGGTLPYGVTGVLLNSTVKAVKAYPVDVNTVDHNNHTLVEEINTIGYDWKKFTGTGYAMADQTVYFIKDQVENIWKVIFTKFEGSSTGNIEFTKEKVQTGSVSIDENSIQDLVIYPNPSNDIVNVVFSSNETTTISLLDLSGRTIQAEQLPAGEFQQHIMNVSELNSGIYMLTIQSGSKIQTEKLIIR